MVENETTPLSSSMTSQSGGGNRASQTFTAVKEKVGEMGKNARDGNFSIRFISLIGGAAMIVVSVVDFIILVIGLHFVDSIVEVYTCLMGLVVVILEGGKQFKILHGMLEKVHHYALFLRYVWGRGCIYFIAGSLQVTQFGVFNKIIGTYMCLTGILYFIVGRQVNQKLEHLKSSIYSEEILKEEFEKADTDHTGRLSMAQFKILSNNLHLNLSRSELEAAFLLLDKDDSDHVSFEEFKSWWGGGYQGKATPTI